MAPPWASMARRMDDEVDARLGEGVDLHPQSTASQFSAGADDLARPARTGCRGVYVAPEATVGPAVGESSSGRAVRGDLMISMQDRYLEGLDLKEGDRAYLSDRDQWFEVLYLTPGDTYRSILHMNRVKEPAA